MSDVFHPEHLDQTAVYWARNGNTKFGQPAYDAPIEIACNWADEATQYLAPDGRTLTSKSHVIVDRDLTTGSAIFLGELVDLTDDVIPMRNNGAHEIMQVCKTIAVKSGKYVREVIL